MRIQANHQKPPMVRQLTDPPPDTEGAVVAKLADVAAGSASRCSSVV